MDNSEADNKPASSRKKAKQSSAQKAAVGRHLVRASRASLAAEGIVYGDRQWKRIVSSARKGQPKRLANKAAVTDREKVSESLTQAYRLISARSKPPTGR